MHQPLVAHPPVGHYAGTVQAPGQPAVLVALDIRHPSPGHYTAELTGPSGLAFVADTIFFQNNRLRLVRPGRPGETVALLLDGDFWRGTLRLDSLQANALLVRRGQPTPTTYRVEEVPQKAGSAWRFAPADASLAGPALALLPDAATAPAAAVWADALARAGTIVLLLPPADTAGAATTSASLQAAYRLLRHTAGADTASIGTWATGPRADAVAQALVGAPGLRPAFFIAQNAPVGPTSRLAYRALGQQHIPVLGLYEGPRAVAAATLRAALRGAAGRSVRVYRGLGADLLVPGKLGRDLPPAVPEEVAQWLRHE